LNFQGFFVQNGAEKSTDTQPIRNHTGCEIARRGGRLAAAPLLLQQKHGAAVKHKRPHHHAFPSLQDAVYRPQQSAPDLLPALSQRFGESFARAIIAAHKTVSAQAERQQEADTMLAKIAEPGPASAYVIGYQLEYTSSALQGVAAMIAHPERVSEQEKWAFSLLAWAKYIDGGWERACTMLPWLLHLDCVFFLGQSWIRKLIAELLSQPEAPQKINRLFFGARGKGKRRATAWGNFPRNLRIIEAIQQRIDDGESERQACKHVHKTLPELGIRDVLSLAQIRKIYRERGKDYYAPLLSVRCGY